MHARPGTSLRKIIRRGSEGRWRPASKVDVYKTHVKLRTGRGCAGQPVLYTRRRQIPPGRRVSAARKAIVRRGWRPHDAEPVTCPSGRRAAVRPRTRATAASERRNQPAPTALPRRQPRAPGMAPLAAARRRGSKAAAAAAGGRPAVRRALVACVRLRRERQLLQGVRAGQRSEKPEAERRDPYGDGSRPCGARLRWRGRLGGRLRGACCRGLKWSRINARRRLRIAGCFLRIALRR